MPNVWNHMRTIAAGFGAYTAELFMGTPSHFDQLVMNASLHENRLADDTESALVLVVKSAGMEAPLVVLSLKQESWEGFPFGIFMVAETALLLVGYNERLFAFDLSGPKMLWEDETSFGFWAWERHDDVVVLSAEVELAGFSLTGEKLWTRFVEPPWKFTVSGNRIEVDVMGEKAEFSLRTGS